MKIVIRTVFFHFLCIIFFGILYFYLKDNFMKNKERTDDLSLIDYILFSTTIQAGVGVGVSEMYPVSFYGKIIMIIQQLILICTHVFTIYVFNI
jgi:hypothetical protein